MQTATAELAPVCVKSHNYLRKIARAAFEAPSGTRESELLASALEAAAHRLGVSAVDVAIGEAARLTVVAL